MIHSHPTCKHISPFLSHFVYIDFNLVTFCKNTIVIHPLSGKPSYSL